MQDTLDLTKLNTYLSAHIEAFSGLRSASKFPDGQSNPTYHLHCDSGDYVLRMQPAGELLKSAHAVDREYRVMKALADTAVPVPEVLHCCLDKSEFGRLFFVMRYSVGKVYWNPALPELNEQTRTALYFEMNRVLAELHNVDIEKVGLSDFGRSGNYFQRQIDRWSKQYKLSATQVIPAMDELMQWLPNNLPDDDGQVSLIHGDYRIDNIMFDVDGSNAVALLDWELSTLGHPYADLAYQCMQWRLPIDAAVRGLSGVSREALGIPSEAEYVERYCEHRGLEPIRNWPFYVAFSAFRFAAILQGVKKRALDGNASSNKALAYGELAPRLADLGIEVIES